MVTMVSESVPSVTVSKSAPGWRGEIRRTRTETGGPVGEERNWHQNSQSLQRSTSS